DGYGGQTSAPWTYYFSCSEPTPCAPYAPYNAVITNVLFSGQLSTTTVNVFGGGSPVSIDSTFSVSFTPAADFAFYDSADILVSEQVPVSSVPEPHSLPTLLM